MELVTWTELAQWASIYLGIGWFLGWLTYREALSNLQISNLRGWWRKFKRLALFPSSAEEVFWIERWNLCSDTPSMIWRTCCSNSGEANKFHRKPYYLATSLLWPISKLHVFVALVLLPLLAIVFLILWLTLPSLREKRNKAFVALEDFKNYDLAEGKERLKSLVSSLQEEVASIEGAATKCRDYLTWVVKEGLEIPIASFTSLEANLEEGLVLKRNELRELQDKMAVVEASEKKIEAALRAIVLDTEVKKIIPILKNERVKEYNIADIMARAESAMRTVAEAFEKLDEEHRAKVTIPLEIARAIEQERAGLPALGQKVLQ